MINQTINFKQIKINKQCLFLIVLLAVQVLGFCYYLNFYEENGYLPSPFIYDKSDTFMDLFNTMYWAYDDGRYTDWGSIYPPLNFLVLKLLNYICEGNQFGDPFDLREGSVNVIFGLTFIYILIPALVITTESWKNFLLTEKVIIYFIVILSTPMLFALERGNLIILVPIFLALVISSSGLKRALYIALLINIKPYFVVLIFYYIVKRNFSEMLTCALLAGVIFLVTGYILDNNFYLFFFNILSFSQNNEIFSLREVMSMPSSISAIGYALNDISGSAFSSGLQASVFFPVVKWGIDLIKWSVLIFSVVTLVKQSSHVKAHEVFCLLIVFISNLGVWVGGYTVIMYMVLIPIFATLRWKWLYLTAVVIILMPLDVFPIIESSVGKQYSYLSGANTQVDWTLGIGSLIRPTLNILLLFMLTMELCYRGKTVIGNEAYLLD